MSVAVKVQRVFDRSNGDLFAHLLGKSFPTVNNVIVPRVQVERLLKSGG